MWLGGTRNRTRNKKLQRARMRRQGRGGLGMALERLLLLGCLRASSGGLESGEANAAATGAEHHPHRHHHEGLAQLARCPQHSSRLFPTTNAAAATSPAATTSAHAAWATAARRHYNHSCRCRHSYLHRHRNHLQRHRHDHHFHHLHHRRLAAEVLPFPLIWLHPPKTGTSFAALLSFALCPELPWNETFSRYQGNLSLSPFRPLSPSLSFSTVPSS